MQSIQMRTIMDGEISAPTPIEYDPENQVVDISVKITQTFNRSVRALVQVGRILNNGHLAKDAIGPAGYLFAIMDA
jgi:hypothetical protein